MSGQIDRSYAILAAAQREDTASIAAPRARLSAARCFIHWMAADLPGLLQSAHYTVSVSQATDQQRESLGWGHCFLASGCYQRNDLAAAELHANAVQEQRHACHRISVVQSAIVLAAIHQAHGRSDEARLALDRVNGYLAEIHSESLLPLVQAFGVEPLTYRELQVLALLAERLSAREVAQRLVISEATAKKHTANIFQKLAVNSRREAVSAAIALGLLPEQP